MSQDTSTTTTTTTQSPSLRPSGERPPADEMINELFLDKKCGKEGTYKLFFESCMRPTDKSVEGIKCENVKGSSGICDLTLNFIFDDQTENQTLTSDQRIPSGFSYQYRCGFGPGKGTNWNDAGMVPREKMLDVIETCRQELYGPPQTFPLWLILLIIFLVIAAVSITATLFWRYWLREKLYGKAPGNGSSSISGVYTSAPFSSISTQLLSGVQPTSSAHTKQPSSISKAPSVSMSRQHSTGMRSLSNGSIRSTSSSARRRGSSHISARAAPTIRSTS